MPAQITNLFLLENLEDASRTRELAESDRNALRAVADWIKTFVARPHRDLGRAGPVCPFVPVAWERKTLWLATERSAGRNAPDVVQLIDSYASNGLVIGSLFFVGYHWAKYIVANPWLAGFGLTALGMALVVVAIIIGG